MKTLVNKRWGIVLFSLLIGISSCGDDDDGAITGSPTPQETDFTELLSNQVNEVIIPSMMAHESNMGELVTATNRFASSINEANLMLLRTAYQQAYLAYQAAAVHNYFATINQNLVQTSNLYPIDTALLAGFIANRNYNFGTEAQERANGFPALDFMLYGPSNVVSYFNADSNRVDFLENLVASMNTRAEMLTSQWQGTLRENFINNGGVALGSSVSTQLNESIVYYEDHIRENKVGIPIGRLGPNDSPITADPAKIEAYYQSLQEGNDNFPLALLRAAVEEMEDLYLGETSSGENAQGYDDLLLVRQQASIDADIKAIFQTIYQEIDARSSITGDDDLYLDIQALVTIYKSDLFPVLNVQDADGISDGD